MHQEARGLDAGDRLAKRLVGMGDNRTAAIVWRIAAEERAHVAVGACVCACMPRQQQWQLPAEEFAQQCLGARGRGRKGEGRGHSLSIQWPPRLPHQLLLLPLLPLQA